MKKDTFRVLKMDCPSEEQLIRMKLEPFNEVKRLEFDIPNRTLVVIHSGETAIIEQNVAQLNLNSSLVSSETAQELLPEASQLSDRKLLWMVFAINSSFFVVEIVTGLIAHSMGLVADSLDMLADAIVYGMSLMVIGSATHRKKQVARLSGVFQLGLAIFGLAEVVRRFLGHEETPDNGTMILVSLFALVGNAASLYMLQKKRSKEAHMQASYIFTSNDVIANIGVIIAGVVVYLTSSVIPDLVIGTIVFFLVVRGAIRILQLSK